VTETNVFELTQPGTFSDPLTEGLRNGARTLLGQAVEAEVAAWLSTHTDKLTNDGRRRLVRHGHLPEREIMTGIGAVAVRCLRVRDRVGAALFYHARRPEAVRLRGSLGMVEAEGCAAGIGRRRKFHDPDYRAERARRFITACR
jgi:hypothetical protein